MMLERSTGDEASGAKAMACITDALPVDCGSTADSARRAVIAATCSGVACFGAPELSPQKPRELMMSATFCGLDAWAASGLPPSGFPAAVAASGVCFDFEG